MSINFGAVKLGKSVSSKFTVRNSTAADVPYAIFEVDERHSGNKLVLSLCANLPVSDRPHHSVQRKRAMRSSA